MQIGNPIYTHRYSVIDERGNVIETHEHEGEVQGLVAGSKCLRLAGSVGHPKANVATK